MTMKNHTTGTAKPAAVELADSRLDQIAGGFDNTYRGGVFIPAGNTSDAVVLNFTKIVYG